MFAAASRHLRLLPRHYIAIIDEFADSFSFRRFSSPLVDTMLLCWLAADLPPLRRHFLLRHFSPLMPLLLPPS
jgi:hypothetical protein